MGLEQSPEDNSKIPVAEMSVQQVMTRWPRITAHIIAESLGYATPEKAAWILKDAALNQPNYCEWIDACFKGDARKAVVGAIRKRHLHQGYMASYPQALAIVRHVNQGNQGPTLASWF